MTRDRYRKRDDMVLDIATNLEWQAEAVGPMSWDKAIEYAESLGNDWRLPSRFELESLLNLERTSPASDFPGMPAQAFWSSSVYAAHPSLACCVDFASGYVDTNVKNCGNRVRCVRRGTSRFGSLAEAEARVAELEAERDEARTELERWKL